MRGRSPGAGSCRRSRRRPCRRRLRRASGSSSSRQAARSAPRHHGRVACAGSCLVALVADRPSTSSARARWRRVERAAAGPGRCETARTTRSKRSTPSVVSRPRRGRRKRRTHAPGRASACTHRGPRTDADELLDVGRAEPPWTRPATAGRAVDAQESRGCRRSARRSPRACRRNAASGSGWTRPPRPSGRRSAGRTASEYPGVQVPSRRGSPSRRPGVEQRAALRG